MIHITLAPSHQLFRKSELKYMVEWLFTNHHLTYSKMIFNWDELNYHTDLMFFYLNKTLINFNIYYFSYIFVRI
jgi:hypothetical protein